MKYKLLRYFLGDDSLTPDEQRRIHDEIDSDRKWYLLNEEIQSDEEPAQWNTARELERLEARLGMTPTRPARRHAGRAPATRGSRVAERGSRPRYRAAMTQAGTVGAIILMIVTGVWMWGVATEDPAARQFVADKGKRVHLTLDDGTAVVLNADSRLVISEHFGDAHRGVTLEGEAYFDVQHDPASPFIIDAGDAVVRVLGTSFGIRSYAADSDVRVVVREGLVSLRPSDADDARAIQLAASEAGFLADGNLHVERNADVSTLLGWIDGRLVFVDRPFVQVARELERWYDIEIVILDDDVRDLPLTATFESQAAFHVIDVISRTLQFDYHVEDRTITIGSRPS